MLVIECTIGQLKADHKLSLLVERTRAVRRALDTAGQRAVRVVPMIVTAKHPDDVKADLDQAKDLGVVVCGIDNIEAVFRRVRLFPDSEALSQDAQNQILPES